MWRWHPRSEWCDYKPRDGSTHEKLEEARSRLHLGFRLLTSKTVRAYISFALSQQVCGNLLHQPQETNTAFWSYMTLEILLLSWKFRPTALWPQPTSQADKHSASRNDVLSLLALCPLRCLSGQGDQYTYRHTPMWYKNLYLIPPLATLSKCQALPSALGTPWSPTSVV